VLTFTLHVGGSGKGNFFEWFFLPLMIVEKLIPYFGALFLSGFFTSSTL